MSPKAAVQAWSSLTLRPENDTSLVSSLQAILRQTNSLIPFELAAVYLLDPTGRTLACLASTNALAQPSGLYSYSPQTGLIAKAIQSQQPLDLKDTNADPFLTPAPPDPINSSAYIAPFRLENLQSGALLLTRPPGLAFSPSEAVALQILATTLALTIDYASLNLRLNQQEHELLAQENSRTTLQLALDRATNRKAEFLANSAHELRTPLNAILGFSEILRDGLVENLSERDQHQALDSIHTAGQHLLKLVNELLDMDKLDAGRMELALEPTSLADLIAEVSSIVAPLANAQSLSIVASLDPESLVVIVDKYRFKQVLYNLLGNAIKFSPPQSQIEITVTHDETSTTIAIQDHGLGIPAQSLDQIFDEFYQLDPAHGKIGSGLGLPLSRRLVELHGGTLRAESTPPQGSTFIINLPSSSPVWTSLAGSKTDAFARPANGTNQA